ncbi:MAG: hypothetical protein JRI72_05705 [Deltaproteobacteria bacterium]|nr:hypothetical protein [Deltaproteobacteria bacterium]
MIAKIILMIRPDQKKWIVRVLVLSGLALISQPFWQDILNAFLEQKLNFHLPQSISIGGWVILSFGIIFHLLNIYLEKQAKEDVNPSLSTEESFPPTNWLTGKDVMEEYNLSGYELYQHIEEGLPVYDENTDIYYKDTKPMELEEMWFRLGSEKTQFIEYDLLSFLFKRKDIEDYLKKSNKKPNKTN